jgi:hypothetical protein
MKKIVATIFLLTYFVGSSGATIQLHYCMDKLIGWSLSSKEKSRCGKCGMEKKIQKGCCHDESKLVKLDKAYKASFNSFDLIKIQPQIQKAASGNFEYLYVFDPLTSRPNSNAPPIQRQASINIFNSVFRI